LLDVCSFAVILVRDLGTRRSAAATQRWPTSLGGMPALGLTLIRCGTAVINGRDWDEDDRVRAAERRAVVLVTPTRSTAIDGSLGPSVAFT
jgi:hypothetical protein